MALSDVTIKRGSGNLGGVLASRDGDSGLLIIDNGWSTPVDPITLFSIKDLEDLGYTGDDLNHEGLLHYHVDCYFKLSKSPLTICAVATDAAYDKLTAMQLYASGNIRQFGVLDLAVTWVASKMATIQLRLDAMELDHTPAVAVYSAYLGSSGTVETTLTDLTLNTAYRVACSIGEDLETGSRAEALRATVGINIVSTIGVDLGFISRNRVNNCIGWKELNDVSGIVPVAGFIDGTTVKSKATSVLNLLDDKHYLFMHLGPQGAGVYYNFDYTGAPETNDFHMISRNRTWDKAYRLMYKALYPKLNATVLLTADGKLAPVSVEIYQNLIESQLGEMVRTGEISAFSVYINPAQPVLATKTLEVVVNIVPTGTIKNIEVTSQFVLNL